jgi:hyperpolarization activated cyclic nucleotide-gated potassium channel 2
MFFIARESAFDPDNSWLGDAASMNSFERYVTSLYWSVTTFTTVGYGDYSPVNSIEKIFGVIFMLLSVIIMSWMIGSITLLIVKKDEKTSLYRESSS